VQATVREAPGSTGEDEIEPLPFFGNLVSLAQQELGVELPSLVAELFGTPDHLIAINAAFALVQEPCQFQLLGAGAIGVPHERPAISGAIVFEACWRPQLDFG
jgi:hypothetical protein